MNPKTRLIFLIGAIAAICTFTVDMYLPGFPAIAQDLNTTEKMVSYTLTSYFIGISIGQLFYGPILDKFGRKKPLLLGLTLYLISSVVCALSPHVYVLVLARFVQALGASVGMVAGPAIIRDQYGASEVAKILSSVLLVMGVAPVIAPSLGSFFISHLSWRHIFYFLTLVSGILILSLKIFLDETHGYQPHMDFRIQPILYNYHYALKHSKFVKYTLGGSISMAIMFAYVSSIPFILMNIYEVSASTFGIIFACNSAGFISGSQFNRLLLRKFQLHSLTRIISFIQLLISITFLISAYNFKLPLSVFLAFVFAVLFLLGFINPNATALALESFDKNIGVASALNGAMRMAAAAVTSAMIGLCYNGTQFPLIWFMVILSSLGFFFIAWARRSNLA
ncbi:multidrug effflux MFS transporter [Ornithobacterium rhinotracheale]|uniref:multidrug effflux MFS transporter n=1 Tax=Ornithobacterium rhinotracheale TaxID=28251 RepID=UPI00403702DD